MRTIVNSGTAHYLKFQPGDGTIYTVMYSRYPDSSDKDNLYVAIGAGNEIAGGYLMRRSSLRKLAQRIMATDDGEYLPKFLKEDHYIQYWLSHFDGFTWTGVVAVLFGMVLEVSTEALELSLEIIGDIHHNNHNDVFRDLLYWTKEK